MLITGTTCEWDKTPTVSMGSDVISLFSMTQIFILQFGDVLMKVTYSQENPPLSPLSTND